MNMANMRQTIIVIVEKESARRWLDPLHLEKNFINNYHTTFSYEELTYHDHCNSNTSGLRCTSNPVGLTYLCWHLSGSHSPFATRYSTWKGRVLSISSTGKSFSFTLCRFFYNMYLHCNISHKPQLYLLGTANPSLYKIIFI